MSDLLSVKFNRAAAGRYNARHARRRLHEIRALSDLVEAFPGLAQDVGGAAFANATRDFQEAAFADDPTDWDGKFGPATMQAAQEQYHADADEDADAVIVNGRRVAINCATPITTWRDPGGLNLHEDGGFGRRSRTPDLIVLHWGGRNPKSCRNALAGRNLSSHFGTGRGQIYQWLDIKLRAYHAGSPANGRSVGIDICQQPTIGLLDWYKERGYNVGKVRNPSSRGPRQVLTLDPETLRATADLLPGLCDALGIPCVFPDTDAVLTASELSAFSGIVGHHHITKSKWDIAPWVPALRGLMGV